MKIQLSRILLGGLEPPTQCRSALSPLLSSTGRVGLGSAGQCPGTVSEELEIAWSFAPLTSGDPIGLLASRAWA